MWKIIDRQRPLFPEYIYTIVKKIIFFIKMKFDLTEFHKKKSLILWYIIGQCDLYKKNTNLLLKSKLLLKRDVCIIYDITV